MTEILTESFCERCGTRYTFESASPRRSRIGRVRVASRGLRNFVMQDESSFSEAMADARSEEERSATTHQLDAFHRTFNFCLTCRQYTCADCWNTAEGRCLTCSPVPGMELPAAPEPMAAEPLAAEAPHAVGEPVAVGPESWPEADLGPDRLTRALGIEPDAEPDAALGDIAPDAELTPIVRGVAPGQTLEDAAAAYEATLEAEEDAELEAETVMGYEDLDAGALSRDWTEPEPEVVAAEPEVVAAEPEPEVVAAEPEFVVAEPEPEFVAEPVAAEPEPEAREDVVPQPTWPIAPTKPDAPAVPTTAPAPDVAPAAGPWLTVAPDEGHAPQWPAAPQWGRVAPRGDMPTTLAGRPLVPQDDAASLWAASAREVLGQGPRPVVVAAAAPATPQPCVSCGLSLSANARFCRRCGTRQG